MTQNSEHKAMQGRRAAEREARRKAELKANMGRRKAQLRARTSSDELNDDTDVSENE